MKYYIKRTLFSFSEALFLSALLWGLLSFPRRAFVWVFLLCLLLLLLLRFLWHRFTLWRILHFSIHRIDKMSGQEFEAFLKVHFEHMGFQAEMTRASNDYGADLILHKKNLTITVQAKRYQANIGVKAVQEVIGSMAYYEADKGLVVTNSFFTKNAAALAKANNVILWDREILIQLLSGEPMTACINALLEPAAPGSGVFPFQK